MSRVPFAAAMAAILAAGTARQNEFDLTPTPLNAWPFDYFIPNSRPRSPLDRMHRKAKQGYSGAELRAMNAERGVGRPPRNRR